MAQNHRQRASTIVYSFPPEWRVLGFLAIAILLVLYLRPLVTLTLLFVTGILLAAALHPSITWMEQRLHLPRGVPAVVLVLGALAAGYASLRWGIPLLLDQAVELSAAVPALYDEARDEVLSFARRNPALAGYLQEQIERVQLEGVLTQLANQVGAAGRALVGVFFAGLLVLVVALYSLLRPLPLVSSLLLMWRADERDRVAQSVNASLAKVRSWLVGQVIAMVSVGVLTTLALWLLGVPYAFLFGVLAALLEVVPTLGPILAALPPMLIAFILDPTLALWVAVAFMGIQAVENNVLVPMVMAQALRVHPVSVAFAVLGMGAVFGLLGVFLAVPLLAVAQAIYEEFRRPPAHEEQEAERQARDALRMPGAE